MLKFKFLFSKKLIENLFLMAQGNWEFSINEIVFENYDLEIKSTLKITFCL